MWTRNVYSIEYNWTTGIVANHLIIFWIIRYNIIGILDFEKLLKKVDGILLEHIF